MCKCYKSITEWFSALVICELESWFRGFFALSKCGFLGVEDADFFSCRHRFKTGYMKRNTTVGKTGYEKKATET
jgi:hypothetical protein